MILATCCDCGARFTRDDDEPWKVRCLDCWARRKNGWQRPPPPGRAGATVHVDPIRQELSANMRGLLNLCHPDKHGGSKLANGVTQWLLDVRDRIEQRTRERAG